MSAELIQMPYRLRCDISRCSNKAEYSIGNPESSKANHFHICEKCLRHFVDSLPDEFKPEKIVEVVKFVEVTPEPKPVQEGLEVLGDLLSGGTVEEGPEKEEVRGDKTDELLAEKPESKPEVKKAPAKKKSAAKRKAAAKKK